MGEQCRVIHTMQRMLLLLNVVCIPLVVVSAQATYDDVEFKCKSGQKVSAVRREKADASGRVGAMTVDCEPLTGAGVGGLQADCKPVTPLKCNGDMEACADGQYLGGVLGYELDKTTGALLLQPICCRSPQVNVLAGSSCRGLRLNALMAPFSVSINDNEVMTQIQCWKQLDRNNGLHDFIWKVQVCNYEATTVNNNVQRAAAKQQQTRAVSTVDANGRR